MCQTRGCETYKWLNGSLSGRGGQWKCGFAEKDDARIGLDVLTRVIDESSGTDQWLIYRGSAYFERPLNY